MKSKFLYQDVDVVSLADKDMVVRCFVYRNYDKVLMETGKLCDNIRVTKNGLVSGVDRMLKSSDSAFKHITDRLNPLRKCRVHASMIMSKFWCHENETGSLYFGPLRKRSRSLSFRTFKIKVAKTPFAILKC